MFLIALVRERTERVENNQPSTSPDKLNEAMRGIAEFIKSTDFGTVRIEIKDGKVSMVEKTIKERPQDKS